MPTCSIAHDSTKKPAFAFVKMRRHINVMREIVRHYARAPSDGIVEVTGSIPVGSTIFSVGYGPILGRTNTLLTRRGWVASGGGAARPNVRDLTVKRLPAVSHRVQQDAPQVVNKLLQEFLA